MNTDFAIFWEKILDSDLTTISDEIIKVFSQPFAEEVYQEYDIGGVVTDFSGHHETAKKHDKIELFRAILKEYHPKVYEQDGDYLNEGLIQYYCFKRNEEQLNSHFEDFVSRDYSYDLLLLSIKITLFFQYTDLVNKVLDQIYDQVKNSPKLMHGAEHNLGVIKYYTELEQLYQKEKNNSNVDLSPFKTTMGKYDFEFDEVNLENIKIGLFHETSVPLKQLVKELKLKKINCPVGLGFRFDRFMLSKNCPFTVSAWLWAKLQDYFDEINTKNFDFFFRIENNSFRKYLNSIKAFLLDNSPEVALTLWGSAYANEFAYAEELITEKQYEKHQKIILDIKEDYKLHNKHNLWKFCFIHQWQPSKDTSQEDWEIEKNEFEASYSLEIDTTEFESLKLDALFGNPIDDGQLSELNAENLFNPEVKEQRHYEVISSDKPYINNNKIGRNEKVNVKYKDGTIKKEVKYKKVRQDVEDGLCEIINA